MGRWGAPCPPGGGETNNKACDTANGFACYGSSPTDAAAFCTLIGCHQDGDCPGSWWCATVNSQPNVTTAKPAFGPTRTVCLPRAYCSPCLMDHDCTAAPNGTPQHCAKDAQGKGFCAPQCSGNANCALDAQCVAQWAVCTPGAGSACASDDDCPPADGTFQHCDAGKCTPECSGDADCAAGQKCKGLGVCSPRAGVCVGDGTFCSPCRSDDDCIPGNGYCLSAAPYSTELFCSVPSTVPHCDAQTANPAGCPPRSSTDNWKAVVCTGSPLNQCLGEVTFSMSGAPGCWTVNR